MTHLVFVKNPLKIGYDLLSLPTYNRPSMTTDDARNDLYATLTYLSEEERARIAHATEIATRAHAGQTRADDSPYITHPIAVARILTKWNADAETIIASILHDVLEDTTLSLGKVKEVFGRRVATLVEGVTKFTQADFEEEKSLDRKVETLRKLFDVMRRDIRVVIIKIADRLHNVRTINLLSEERRRKLAQETLDIYYKLTYHLGMNEVRREFSDLCMPHIAPKETKELLAIRTRTMKGGEAIAKDMSLIAGQKPIITKARKSIATFKLREGSPLGVKVTLRGKKMYDFLDRLVHIVLARSRDFQGLKTSLIDSQGNVTIGIKEHLFFPEISPEESKVSFGLEVTITTTAKTKEEGLELFLQLGFPFII